MEPRLQIGCSGEARTSTKPFPVPLTRSRARAVSAPAGRLAMAPAQITLLRGAHSTFMGRSRRDVLLRCLRPAKLIHTAFVDLILRHARIYSAAHCHAVREASGKCTNGALHGCHRGVVGLEAVSCPEARARHLIAGWGGHNHWPARHRRGAHGSGLAPAIVYDELPLARGLGFQRRVLPRGRRRACGLAPSQCNGNRDQQKCTLHQALPPFRGAKPMVELAAMSNRFLESMGAFRFRKLMDHPSRPERRVGTAKPITAANQSASIDSHYSLDPNLNFQDKETL